MKAVILLAVSAVVAAAAAYIEADIDYYVTGNDNLDIEAIVENADEFKEYIDCFKGLKPCTEVANSFKVHIPEAVVQACRRCNSAQKHLLRRFLEALKEKFPEDYDFFKKAFDPENKYFDALEKAVSDY